ncbi:monothiol glutaredoxin-S14, chloroplastic [Punica granatum]|uniref:Monothiol glutaredoxin-S14, chloroplastic n=1 Tax=Punica granatum TaxID=22663 RepID=A0A6P8CFN1_PUNGR|nr:monothiol glutaredoxin-S14, chloroplastic [Punica granatum]
MALLQSTVLPSSAFSSSESPLSAPRPSLCLIAAHRLTGLSRLPRSLRLLTVVGRPGSAVVGSRPNGSSFRCFASALTPELKSTLDKVVTSNKVVVFMKGTKDFPQCGFSNTVVQILKSLNMPFETINILENEMLRQGLKEYSSWPTFPQLYIQGEFFGGCDITVEAYNSGELQELLEKAMCS